VVGGLEVKTRFDAVEVPATLTDDLRTHNFLAA
jgi:hypothetical protein